ncbi:glycosyltransferase family 2 protein [Paludibacter sp. 221]|uniref:glycosyltransferase family 2 protein n=1 Tax=Paludibacter sp. 221 TaxID=2302939 RepID=UPI0013D2A5E4|nr:glycosyltransferase family 2 protein [Paludibacter sp. 221]NDV46037.1 glycosyltransferase family 2 protein [Paludibacter sp. 221]
MKISIIVPIYNVEKYLVDCIRSIQAQSYTDLEIILVNDGSTDSSPLLCDKYAKQDSRIKVIHKRNGGLSDARNAGLGLATGKYVVFLDSDDYWLDNRLIEVLVDEINNYEEMDVVMFLRADLYEGEGTYCYAPKYDMSKIINKNRNGVFYYLLINQLFNMSACFQILRRDFLLSNELFFEKGLLSEDVDWSLSLWSKINSISAVNIYGYCYRHRENSITTTYSLKNLQSYEYMFKKWKDKIKNENFDIGLKQLYLGYLAYLVPTLLYNYFVIPKKERIKGYTILKNMQDVLSYSVTKKSNRVKKSNHFFGFKITCLLFGIYGLYSKFGFKGMTKIWK